MPPKLIYSRSQQKLLELQGVSLSFGNRPVLRDVNATITKIERPDAIEGQVICFLGPSGMGKTQLSRIICGLQKPTSGVVLLDTDVPTRKGLVGMVPQNYPLFEFMTVQQNLTVAGRQGGLTDAENTAKAAGFVDAFGLSDYLTLYPKALSGGTRQRVAIARQMMCADHYLVMDEPFSGLDPIMKAKASEAITQLAAKDGLNTIIVITHDISEGLAVADMVWLLGLEREITPAGVSGFLPGARLVEQYDLASMGFAWHPDIQSDPQFLEFVGVVKARFKTLR
jgi:ABC-type nitrate/sulfonate/bicarbonate transport system ATPase subunit